MKTIKQMYVIEAPVESVWKALVDPELVEGWSGARAKMKDEEGFAFELWNGDIWGKNVKVIKEKRLVQEWYAGKWEEPSTVIFTMIEKDPSAGHSTLRDEPSGSDSKSSGQVATLVGLVHENVPDEGAEDIENGWRNYYMVPLKTFVEAK